MTFTLFSRHGSPAMDSVDVPGSEIRHSTTDGNGSSGEDELVIMKKYAEKEMS